MDVTVRVPHDRQGHALTIGLDAQFSRVLTHRPLSVPTLSADGPASAISVHVPSTVSVSARGLTYREPPGRIEEKESVIDALCGASDVWLAVTRTGAKMDRTS